jgi:HEAT repeat protein
LLAAMGDRVAVLRAADRLGAQQRVQPYDVAVVRALVALDAREACPELRRLLEMSPLNGWRAGLEKGALVQELVRALGALGDTEAAPLLVTILESKSQEYRAVLPAAAFSLGQLRHEPALTALERIVLSPKDAGMCEAVWAIGEIGGAHPEARGRARALLDLLHGLEPGAEAIRLAALAKIGAPSKEKELRAAIDRALVEPGFRQDETSRRRAWAFRALEDLASVVKKKGSDRAPRPLAFDYDAVRHWVTRDDHRVRRAAQRAFAAWEIPIPKARPYFAFALPDDVDGLLEALRDPLGVFKHNVATKLAALGNERAVRPLAEATARLFAAPVTSTYEYDDAPPPLVAFVRALAKLNDKTYNGVLLEGLRSANHQVRAVVAENAPDDERFVPELMAMLGDPRSFLRSRAEKSLTSLGALEPPVEPATTELMAVPQRLQG